MTREEFNQMMQEAGFGANQRATLRLKLQRFAAFVAAAERERVTFELVNEAQRAVQEAVWAERERIAAWVEDMCAGLDAKTIANGIRNNGNDDIGAFEVRK